MLQISRLALALAMCGAAAGHAADIKVGIALDISGPFAALGAGARDGFELAIEKLDDKLGGQPATFLRTDFGGNPEQANQLVARYLQRDRIDFFTGPIGSNAALAVGPALFAAKVPYLSANPGPSAYAGERCNPYFFAQYQNDTYDEAAGKVANEKGYRKVVFFFLPGAMGINFVKQFVGGGLKDIPLIAPGFSADEDVIQAVGEAMIGVLNTAHWTHDLDNAANTAFVAAFRKKYDGRYPSVYAAMAYDTLMAMDAAVRDAGGKLGDRDALLKALKNPSFQSVRGEYSYGANNFPVQNYYLREVGKDADGRITNKLVGTTLEKHQDAYVGACKM